MSHILLTGIAVLDITNTLTSYPEEDSEVRAISQQLRRGGNASNTASVLSQLRHQCFLATTLADDQAGEYLKNDLDNSDIMLAKDCILSNSTTPTSYITLNQKNGSRTIIHYRDLAELNFSQFDKISLDKFEWFHFEGRNIDQTRKMMQKAQTFSRPVSLELEKNRTDIDTLVPMANIVFISRPFALCRKFTNAEDCLRHFNSLFPEKLFICSWGEEGASAIQYNEFYTSPAIKIDNIVDTLGAGDTFIAAFIHAQLNTSDIDESLTYACKLAGLKCTQSGLNNLEALHEE